MATELGVLVVLQRLLEPNPNRLLTGKQIGAAAYLSERRVSVALSRLTTLNLIRRGPRTFYGRTFEIRLDHSPLGSPMSYATQVWFFERVYFPQWLGANKQRHALPAENERQPQPEGRGRWAEATHLSGVAEVCAVPYALVKSDSRGLSG